MSKKKVFLLIVGLVAAIAVILGIFLATPVLKVKKIQVTGNQRIPAEQIVESSTLAEGQNMLRISPATAAGNVADIPWIESVTVTRAWPSEVDINVTERTVNLFAQTPDGTVLVDTNGQPFIIDTPPEGAIEVSGDAASSQDFMRDTALIVDAFSPDARGLIDRIEASSPTDVTFFLKDGRTIFWGSMGKGAATTSASDEGDDAQADVDTLMNDKVQAFETVIQREGGQWNISNPKQVSVR